MIGNKISRGAHAFLQAEYTVMLIFIVIFGVVVLLLGDFFSGNRRFEGRCYALIAYIIGALTSMTCGYIGMSIATQTNYRTTYKAITSLEEAFKLAY